MRSPTVPLAISLAALLAPEAREVEPVRPATCLRFYSLEGDVKPDLLRKAAVGLSTLEAEAKLVLGPVGVSSRPKFRFVVLEIPTGTTAKDVQAAMRKVSPKTVELEWTAFQGKDRKLPEILGYSGQECVVGMDNDMRWFDLEEGLARFFYVPGKLDENELRSRFERLYQPFDAEELGELVLEKIEWKLAEPLDAATAKAAEKAIAKLAGVRKAKIDVEKCLLTAEIAHDGLRGAAPGSGAGGRAAESSLPSGSFLAGEVLDALTAAKVGLEIPAAPGEKR